MKLEKILPTISYVKKESGQVLTCAKVQNGELTVTDLETTITFKQDFGLSEGLYPVKTLGEFSILSDLELSEYPTNTCSEIVESITVNPNELFDVNKYSSDDETRIFLCSVAFELDKMVATDGYTLKSIDTDKQLKETYLVPNNSIRLLEKLCKLFKITGKIDIEFNKDFATIKTKNFDLSARLIKSDYLKWQAILPKKYSQFIDIYNYPKFSVIKPYLNKGSNVVQFEGISGKVILSIPSTDIKIEVGSCEADFVVGFNAKFLERARNKSKLLLKFNSSLGPVMVNDSIIMPMKL